jgi:hypothetical protein
MRGRRGDNGQYVLNTPIYCSEPLPFDHIQNALDIMSQRLDTIESEQKKIMDMVAHVEDTHTAFLKLLRTIDGPDPGDALLFREAGAG